MYRNFMYRIPEFFGIWVTFKKRREIIWLSFFHNSYLNDSVSCMLVCLIHYWFCAKFVQIVVFYVFHLRRYEVNQELEVHGLTVTVFRGTCLSSIKDMLELKWSISDLRLKLFKLEKALDISWLNSVKLILLIRRSENVTLLTIGFGRSISTQTVLWSEI